MLLDTSGLYCYFDGRDARNADAVSLMDRAAIRVTHNYVLAELVALCDVRGVSRARVLAFVASVTGDRAIRVVWIDQALHDAAVRLLLDRRDKNYSLCDAISFLVMRQFGLTDALTTDRHFEQEGFRRLLPS